mmetsp:Transcript_19297/g.45121  ORF Transcript_19297/g.45121 Transcript_19297/m.45121 type:complete len:391 (+) Transcript_19297:521-1693(+)
MAGVGRSLLGLGLGNDFCLSHLGDLLDLLDRLVCLGLGRRGLGLGFCLLFLLSRGNLGQETLGELALSQQLLVLWLRKNALDVIEQALPARRLAVRGLLSSSVRQRGVNVVHSRRHLCRRCLGLGGRCLGRGCTKRLACMPVLDEDVKVVDDRLPRGGRVSRASRRSSRRRRRRRSALRQLVCRLNCVVCAVLVSLSEHVLVRSRRRVLVGLLLQELLALGRLLTLGAKHVGSHVGGLDELHQLRLRRVQSLLRALGRCRLGRLIGLEFKSSLALSLGARLRPHTRLSLRELVSLGGNCIMDMGLSKCHVLRGSRPSAVVRLVLRVSMRQLFRPWCLVDVLMTVQKHAIRKNRQLRSTVCQLRRFLSLQLRRALRGPNEFLQIRALLLQR